MAKKNNSDTKSVRGSEQTAKKSGVLTNPIRNMLITTLVCAVLAVAFLLQPYLVQEYCGYVLGGLVCAIGLIYILIYFCRKPVSGVYRSEFAIGMVAIAAGAYVILASLMPDATGISITLRLIVSALGVLIAADGILKLQYAFDLLRMKFGGWWFAMLLSLLGIALGVVTTLGLVDSMGVRMAMGADDFLSAMIFLGGAFCVNAVLDLITLILVAVRNGKAARAEAAAEAAEAAAAAAVAAAAAAAPAYYPPYTPPAAPAAPVAPVEPVAPAAPEVPAAEVPTVEVKE